MITTKELNSLYGLCDTEFLSDKKYKIFDAPNFSAIETDAISCTRASIVTANKAREIDDVKIVDIYRILNKFGFKRALEILFGTSGSNYE